MEAREKNMPKFCTKCGAALAEGQRFCNSCGAPLAGAGVQTGSAYPPAPGQPGQQSGYPQPDAQQGGYPPYDGQQTQRQGAPASGSSKTLFLLGGVAALLVLLLLAGGGYAFYAYQKQQTQDSPVVIDQEDPKKADETPLDNNVAVPVKDILQASQEELEACGDTLEGDIIATSYGHSPDGFLAVKQLPRTPIFVLLDRKNHRVLTCCPVNMSLREFAKRREQRNPAPLIVRFGASKPDLGRDRDKGKWEHFNHHMDILANYEYDGAGELVYGMQYSGHGLHQTSYDVPLYEQKHVDMMNLFLAEAYELYKRSQGTSADAAMDLQRK